MSFARCATWCTKRPPKPKPKGRGQCNKSSDLWRSTLQNKALFNKNKGHLGSLYISWPQRKKTATKKEYKYYSRNSATVSQLMSSKSITIKSVGVLNCALWNSTFTEPFTHIKKQALTLQAWKLATNSFWKQNMVFLITPPKKNRMAPWLSPRTNRL